LDYNLIYKQLIDRAQAREILGYREKHHIIPKCLGGSDEENNIVALTAREHFIAHQLLVKIYPKVRGLSWALLLMCGKKKYAKSRAYEWAKKAAAKHISESRAGVKLVMTPSRRAFYASRVGAKHTEESKAKMSKVQKGKKVSEATKKLISEKAKLRGVPLLTDEQKAALKTRMKGNDYRKGKPNSQEERARISEFLKGNTYRRGKPASEETRQKIIKGLTGRSPSAETRAKLSACKRKLSDEQILAVRKDAESKLFTQKQMGSRNGMSQAEVSRILRNESHKNIR